MKYCGIERPNRSSALSAKSTEDAQGIFVKEPVIAKSLGQRIVEAIYTGADIGTSVPVTYDNPDDSPNREVDVLSSPNHDFFDIAEHFGEVSRTDSVIPKDNNE